MGLGGGMAELTSTGGAATAASSQERLVNLTGHELVIYAQQATAGRGSVPAERGLGV